MTTWTREQLERLVAHGVPESASLEYKEALPLRTTKEKLEALKDLSGMANGGGGTVIFGIEEGEGDWPVASAVRGLTDWSLPGRLEDIVRSGIQPPLLARHELVELESGHYVLVVEVDRSPLGPYMVEAYGSRTYHRRAGTRTFPMTERDVRDAYALAARVVDRRRELWVEHGLPLASPTGDPWLLVSALPADPLRDVIDLMTVAPGDFTPPTEPTVYLNNWDLADLTPALQTLTMWPDGFFSDDVHSGGSMSRIVRIHRDGALAFAVQLDGSGSPNRVSALRISRILNGILRYMGWVWHRFELAGAVEIHLEVRRIDVVAFDVNGDGEERRLQKPAGSPVDFIGRSVFVNADELLRASSRHVITRDFADRLAQAFGVALAEYPFRMGELYGRTGEPLAMSVGSDAVYADQGGHIAWIKDPGVVVSTNNGHVVGRYEDGVLTDVDGRVLAVVELAPGAACPDGFAATTLRSDPRGVAAKYGQSAREPVGIAVDAEPPRREWSDADPLTTVRGW